MSNAKQTKENQNKGEFAGASDGERASIIKLALTTIRDLADGHGERETAIIQAGQLAPSFVLVAAMGFAVYGLIHVPMDRQLHLEIILGGPALAAVYQLFRAYVPLKELRLRLPSLKKRERFDIDEDRSG